MHFPKGDWTRGRILCEGGTVEPCNSLVGPFHLGIDQQDRIWCLARGLGERPRYASKLGVPIQPVSDTSSMIPSGPVYFTSTLPCG